jgi:hypothetical protein
MLNKLLILFIIFFTGLISTIEDANAQDGVKDISEIKYLYDGFRFEEAIILGESHLKNPDQLSQKKLGYIHQYLAFAYFTIGESDSARLHFLSLLSISPSIELDPLETSPKIIDFFQQTKNDFEKMNDQKLVLSYPQYIFIEDKRPGAAWRSAILPGWGQFYKDQPTRGYIFGGAFFTSLTILGISAIYEKKYKDDYLNSTDPQEIQSKYDQYNKWSKVRQVATYSTIGIWLLSFADALWSDYPKMEISISSKLNLDPSGFTIVYRF